MKNYEIKNATAIYTGGGIYIYYGQLSNGLWFRTWDENESICICNSDTSVEEADYGEFYDEHMIEELINHKYKSFFNTMLQWIIDNDKHGNYLASDLQARMIKEEITTTAERIRKLEQELLRLKRIEELETFLNHMRNTFDVLMGNGCTDESVNTFYNMQFTITFNNKTITIDNGADTFQEIEYTIQREIDELNE